MSKKAKPPKPSQAEKDAQRRAEEELKRTEALQKQEEQAKEQQRKFGRLGISGSIFTSSRGRLGLTSLDSGTRSTLGV